jgi:rhodanese-related sulfurtransferase
MMGKRLYFSLLFLIPGLVLLAQDFTPNPLTTSEGLEEAIASRQRILILDVRDYQDYRKAHIPGARNLPFAEIMYNPPRVRKTMIIVVYGRMRSESDRAQLVLQSFGFKNVYDFGPFRKWQGETIPPRTAENQ